MNAVTHAVVANASIAALDTVQGAAAMSVFKKSLDLQASNAAQLIAALPQVPLATFGLMGTRVNAFA